MDNINKNIPENPQKSLLKFNCNDYAKNKSSNTGKTFL